jgi:hypothetical protein
VAQPERAAKLEVGDGVAKARGESFRDDDLIKIPPVCVARGERGADARDLAPLPRKRPCKRADKGLQWCLIRNKPETIVCYAPFVESGFGARSSSLIETMP